MKKLYLLCTLCALALVLSGCTWFGAKTDSTNGNGSEESITGTMMDLFNKGKDMKCVYSQKDESGNYEGTTYTSNKKLRSDFTVKNSDNSSYESHSIMDSEYMYIWTTLSNQGTKIKLSEYQTEENNADMKAGKQADVNQNYDYKCSPWIKDNSKFEVPTNIEFKDLTEEMNKATEQIDNLNTGDVLKNACASCDSSPTDDAKETCRQSLKCE